MDPFLFMIFCYAAYHVWQDVNALRRADRDKQSPKPGAIRHGLGWWAREAINGFPVTTGAMHKGWLAHHAAALQHAADVDKHRGVIDAFKTVGQRAKTNAKQIEDDHLPTRTRADRKRSLTLIVNRPRGPHQSDPAPVSSGDPDPTPTTDPEPVDKPVDSPVPAAPPSDPEPPAQSDPTPQEIKPMTTQTVTVPEVTYDQLQAKATKTLVQLEARLQELRLEQWAAIADQITGALRTGNTVGNAADMADQIEQEIKLVQQRIDSTQHFKAELRREHGGINEAVQNAPVPAAQPEFYEG